MPSSSTDDRWHIKDSAGRKVESARYGQGKQWRARYRDDAGKEHAKHFDRKIDAQRWLNEITTSVLTGQYVDPRAGRMTFREYAEQWRNGQVFRPSTAGLVKLAMEKRVYPVIGDLQLRSIDRDTIVGLVKALSDAYAPATVEVTYSYASTVFKAAVASRKIATTPCVGIVLPQKLPKAIDPMSVEDVFSIAAKMTPRYKALVVLGAGTGMRRSEIFGLTADRIKFLERKVIVDRQLLKVVDGAPVFGPTKTVTSDRVIPLPQVVADALAAHIKAYDVSADGLVFTVPSGSPMKPASFWEVWRRACRDAGVKDRTPHDLRHYYASLLIRYGESVKVVQARLGHKSAQETLDTYAKLWPDSEDRTRAAVDSMLKLPADYLRTGGSES